MAFTFTDTDELCIKTLRTLAMDAVQKANSGHPGAPMGLAVVGQVLWSRFLKFDPRHPHWPDRDRFVLSCGHASLLLYGLLHLSGYDLSLDDLKNFRQWGSRTPGHPERGETPGVEATTGPLGQGLGNAVGMALGERMLASRFNGRNRQVVDHRTWVLVSDGDLMEGVAAEASSLAGHLGLDRLCVIYDDNKITIDGPTHLSFSEDVMARYAALGWHVQAVDGMDPYAVATALEAAVAESDRPSLIAARTRIGFGSPAKEGTSSAHGAPLGEEEVRATKEAYGWDPQAQFLVPEGAAAPLTERAAAGATLHAAWQTRMEEMRQHDAPAASEWDRRQASDLPAGWEDHLPVFTRETGDLATRAASGKVLAALAPALPELVGGSADLAGSNNTHIPDSSDVAAGEYGGRILHFGVREHAMGALMNGMNLHGGLRPFGATFLIFSDYARPAIRLAALSRLPAIWVFTHDSIGLGEDGPTHQPVEHLASLRAMPNLHVIRPADANETAAAWRVALTRRDGPTALVLSRQKLPLLEGEGSTPAGGLARGAYILAEAEGGSPDLILMASGSEVALVLAARDLLQDDGIPTRVVSFPCWELFAGQPESYREEVLPSAVTARLAVEAGASLGWDRWVGWAGACVTLDRFGASAPGPVLFEKFGFVPGRIVSRARELLG
ncbi:MAG: transketolase [Acidobacteria bacterium]|nr:transketolase [Acidobacteriota bacterium]